MPKFITAIDVNYLLSWKTAEGVREMLQNGRDEEIEHSSVLKVTYRKASETLVIENEGASLPLKALLIGFSTKREDGRLAGQYGEGLVFGILALVRAGHQVKVRTGSEVWVPRIERHDQVAANVLVFQITTGRKDEKRVAVEIGGISEDTYKSLPEKFLWLEKTRADEERKDRIRVPGHGSLLLDPKFTGQLFVKGIWVCTNPELLYGYDFENMKTDRDRKMIDDYDLRWEVRKIWQNALASRPDIFQVFLTMLKNSAKDVEGIDSYCVPNFTEECRQAIAADFVKSFGEDAVPVDSLSDTTELEHFGKKGIVTPKPLKAMLESVMGKVEDVKKKLAQEAHKLYSVEDLTKEEWSNLRSAMVLVNEVEPVESLNVTDFRDPGILGLFKNGEVFIAKRVLVDRDETLATVVHEIAHKAGGGDGEKNHVANLERIWSGIVKKLRAQAQAQAQAAR